MNILRKLAIGLLAMILFLASLGMAWTDVAKRTFRDREVVKAWLEEANFYNTITPAVLESINIPEGDNGSQVPFEDPKLLAQVNKVLDADFIRTNTGNVLDGMYDWLEGKTSQPDFAIELGDIRKELAGALGDYATERAAKLPVCKAGSGGGEPLTLTCLPRGISAASIGRQAERELLKNKEFLSESTLSAEDITNNDGQNPLNNLENSSGDQARALYKLGGYGTILLGLVVLLSGLGIVFLSSSRAMGMRRAGITLLGSAVLLGLSYFFLDFAPKRLKTYIETSAEGAGSTAQSLMSRMVDVISADVRGIIGAYAIVFALLGIGLLVGSIVLKKHMAKDIKQTDVDPTPPVDDSAKKETEQADKSEKQSKPDKKPKV